MVEIIFAFTLTMVLITIMLCTEVFEEIGKQFSKGWHQQKLAEAPAPVAEAEPEEPDYSWEAGDVESMADALANLIHEGKADGLVRAIASIVDSR